MSTNSNTEPEWHTKSAVIELDRNGGGFAAIELIAPAAIAGLTVRGTKLAATRFEVTIGFSAKNLPPKKLPCKVGWTFKDGKGKGKALYVAGPTVDLDAGAGTVTAVLDLMSAGVSIGRVLETGGAVTVTLTVDYPHIRAASIDTELKAPLALHIGTQGTKDDPLLGAIKSGDPHTIGQKLQLSLTRSDWKCHVRMRVDTPGNNDVAVDFGTGDSGPKPWRIGESGGALQLPELATTGTWPGKLPFHLLLEVSDDGTNYAVVQHAWLALALPELTSFEVVLGEGVSRIAEAHDSLYAPYWVQDNTVTASGRFSGFAPGYSPPFVVELWGLGRIDQSADAPVVIYPLQQGKLAIGALHEGGGFSAVLDHVVEMSAALLYQSITLFAVLRLASTDPPVAIAPYLGFGSLRPFSDEDFTKKKTEALGVCSSEVGPNVRATRAPVIGDVSVTIEKDTLALRCNVLGPPDYWKAAKPKFMLDGKANEFPASYEAVPKSARGILKAAVPFKNTGPIAGKKSVTTTLELGDKSKGAPKVLQGGGKAAPFDATPKLGPVRWLADKSPKDRDRVHFACATQFFPKLVSSLTVQLRKASESVPWQVPIEFEHKVDDKSGSADDDGFEFFLSGTNLDEAKKLLEAGQLEVIVARPKGAEVLFKIDALKVNPWSGVPTKVAKL